MDSRFQEGPLGQSTFTDITSASFPPRGEDGKQLQRPRLKGGRYGELKGAGRNKDDEMCTICQPPPISLSSSCITAETAPVAGKVHSPCMHVAFPL